MYGFYDTDGSFPHSRDVIVSAPTDKETAYQSQAGTTTPAGGLSSFISVPSSLKCHCSTEFLSAPHGTSNRQTAADTAPDYAA